MKLAKILMIFCIIALMVLTGCALAEKGIPSKKVSTRPTATGVEAVLIEAVEAGQLVAVYEHPVNSGNENHIIIKNAYDEVKDFKIEPCLDCEIINELKIEANGHHIIKFSFKGKGKKTITVTDELNNYYGSASFMVN